MTASVRHDAIRRLPQLSAAFLGHSVKEDLTSRSNVASSLLKSVITIAIGLAIISSLFTHVTEVGGWQFTEVLAVFGTFTMVQSVIGIFLAPNLAMLSHASRHGELEHLLMQPVDFQLQISLRRVNVWSAVDFLFGLGLVGYAATVIGDVTPVRVAAFTLCLSAGVVITYSIWLVLAAATISAVRADNFMHGFQAILAAGRFPTSAFPTAIKILLTVVVPVTFVTTVPAAALVRPDPAGWIVASAAVAITTLAISRWVLWRTIKRYLTEGS